MAHFLSREQRIHVLNLLVEGMSIRAIERVTGIQKKTVLHLLEAMGEGSAELHDQLVRGISCTDMELDEIWAFVWCKQKRSRNIETIGDQYTFTALDSRTKLILSWQVGKRTWGNAVAFLDDVKSRLVEGCHPQISSDGFSPYPDAVERAFGSEADYGQIVKVYAETDAGRGRYSPGAVVNITKSTVSGHPMKDRICTSHVERGNLTMRMGMRRFTRLTNGFSKKLDNLKASISLHFAHYNFCRIHMSLRVTPAVEAGLTDHVWDMGELLDAALENRGKVAIAA